MGPYDARLYHLNEVKPSFSVVLGLVASVTPIDHAHNSGIAWLSMLWSLAPVIKNPFFYLLPDNLFLSWTRALPLPEGKRWQVRGSPKMASGPNLLFGEGNKLFRSEEQLLSSPLLQPRRVSRAGGGTGVLFRPKNTYACDPSLGTVVRVVALASHVQVTGGEKRGSAHMLIPYPSQVQTRVCNMQCLCLIRKHTNKETPVNSQSEY